MLSLWKNRGLIFQFTKREIAGRYRGSKLGMLWSILTPIIMLTIYTFVFSEIFQSRWESGSENKIEFALVVFVGLIIFNIFSEVFTRAPSLILSNQNYVKKVIFPLEILPLITIGSALFHAFVSFAILIIALYALMGIISWTLIFLPLILIPFVLMCAGLAWIFASLGVYIRDINYIITLVVQGLMLLSPIFYPTSMIPKDLLFIYELNPMAFFIQEARSILIWGELPDFYRLSLCAIGALVLAIVGYYFFRKTKAGFADVL